ncbi:MAG: peptidoglycan DD-metalloendopeptidase family protein [Gammaproteobacteria bacterium]|jgi:murein DD-endopeptidase MepM/ murein hydrolase activator NlpD
MNIILFTNRHGQVWNVEFRPVVAVTVMVALMLSLLTGAFFTGLHIGEDGLDYVAEMREEIESRHVDIRELRKSAQADINALTLRIGQLQGQMLRLNALGERLVSQGDLDVAEFDFDSAPAVGGPEGLAEDTPVALDEVLAMLESLDAEMSDREQKLSVLESLLMSRSLSERVMPAGRPIDEGWLSSRFGKRNDPFTGKQEFHKGLDFAGKKGSDVIAVGDGVVSWSGKRYGYGNLVEINHGNGYVTRYGHNEHNLVQVGDTVRKGQQIALMGSTGRSTGPHVHFEVLHHGKAVNPVSYLGE